MSLDAGIVMLKRFLQILCLGEIRICSAGYGFNGAGSRTQSGSFHYAELDSTALGKGGYVHDVALRNALPLRTRVPAISAIPSVPRVRFPIQQPSLVGSGLEAWDALTRRRQGVQGMSSRDDPTRLDQATEPSAEGLRDSGIRVTETNATRDLQLAADFLAKNFYEIDANPVSTGIQRGALGVMFSMDLGERKEQKVKRTQEALDLVQREAQVDTVRSNLPHALVVAKTGEDEIVGCLSLDIRVQQQTKQEFRPINGDDNVTKLVEDKDLVPVMSNLAVRTDMRGRGLAKSLLAEAEGLVKSWTYPTLYLSVEADNSAAVELYKSSGYIVYVDDAEDACVRPGKLFLEVKQCKTLRLMKTVSEDAD